MLRGFRDKFSRVGAAAPRAYWYVWWGTLVNRLGSFVIPLLTIYLTKVRGLDVSEAGGVVSVFGAGQIGASFVGGQMSDRLGRRITMVVSLFGGALAMLALGFQRDLTGIMVWVGVLGFVGELYRPAVLAFVADIVPEPDRVHAYGLLYWVINLGFSVAAVLGGFLAEIDFTILFIADAITMALYGVIVLVAVPETRPPRPAVTGDAAPPPARSWVRDPEFVVFAGITFLLALLPYQAGAALAAHMTWQGFTPAAYGAVMAVNGLLIIAFQPSITSWSAKLDASRTLAFTAVLYGLGMAVHGAAGVVPLHVLAVCVWTLAEILESPVRSTLVAAMAPAQARGRYQGALVMMFGAGQLVAPKLGTWIWEHEGPGALWYGCLGLGSLIAIALLASAPALRRRIARGAPQ